MELPIIHALWIGDRLGKISSSCLRSFVLRGHKVLLHTYGEILDLPEGVQCVDANAVIPKNKIFGGVSKSMLALNESIIDIKEH